MAPPRSLAPALAIPTEAATKLLAQARPLEPTTATQAHTVDQGGDLTACKVHLTRPAPTLTAHRNQATGGDPGTDGPGRDTEALDNLRHSNEHIIFHGGKMHEARSHIKPFLLCYVA